MSCCWHSYHSPTAPWLVFSEATDTAGTPPVSIVLGAERHEVSLSLMWVIADECAKLGLTVHFIAQAVLYSPPHTAVMAMSVKSLCLSAHISNVLKISYMKLSKSNYAVRHIREKTSSHIPLTSSHIPLEKEGQTTWAAYKLFFKYFSKLHSPLRIASFTLLADVPSALVIAVLLMPKK